jgi:hypothetical protein
MFSITPNFAEIFLILTAPICAIDEKAQHLVVAAVIKSLLFPGKRLPTGGLATFQTKQQNDSLMGSLVAVHW